MRQICSLISGLVAVLGRALTGRVADKILRDLKKMRSNGIYPRDIHARNYRARLLVDMSIARTTPYFLFDIRGP